MSYDDSWKPAQPNYTILKYTDQIYKVCYFPNGAPYVVRSGSVPHESYDHKLDSSISRSRRIILELGLCNDWEFFATFTLDSGKFDRCDLDNFRRSFSQFLRDYRKKVQKNGFNTDIRFLLIPELHSDGESWHMHGLFSGVAPFLKSFLEFSADHKVPDYLKFNDYYIWEDYHNKFGFCSFAPVRNKVACGFYITKYLYKSLSAGAVDVGRRVIFHSVGLNKSSKHGEIYGHSSYLDQFLENDYEFCKTGFTHVDHGLSWDFALEFMDLQPMSSSDSDEIEVDHYVESVQLYLEGFRNA